MTVVIDPEKREQWAYEALSMEEVLFAHYNSTPSGQQIEREPRRADHVQEPRLPPTLARFSPSEHGDDPGLSLDLLSGEGSDGRRIAEGREGTPGCCDGPGTTGVSDQRAAGVAHRQTGIEAGRRPSEPSYCNDPTRGWRAEEL